VCVESSRVFDAVSDRFRLAGVGDESAEFGDADYPLVVGVVGELLFNPFPDQRGDFDAAVGGQGPGSVQGGGWPVGW